ncbi:hypothetical protein L3073_00075 [Ancylomarina sp. DW003]|nr:hypothetical protein [Ancylomarina sp. DW003]MDE5420598.1 hypothetical protein [Ancylomarina sp. DW003]
MSRKKQIYTAFENSKFEEIILGNADFFVSEPTYRESHDMVLMFYYLYEWLEGKKDEEGYVFEIKEVFFRVIQGNSQVDQYQKTLKSLLMVLSYCIEANDREKWIIDKSFLINELIELLSRYSKEDIAYLRIEIYWKQLGKYLLELPSFEDVLR